MVLLTVAPIIEQELWETIVKYSSARASAGVPFPVPPQMPKPTINEIRRSGYARPPDAFIQRVF